MESFEKISDECNATVSFQAAFIPPDLRILQTLDLLIEINFKDHKCNSFYAGQMGLSKKYLNNLLKNYKDITLYKYIQKRLHAEAINLLVGTRMSIKMIAYELGYCDPGHFIRNFNKYELSSPKAFRKHNLALLK